MERPALVLVADDQPLSRENTARALREAGHRVILCSDGQEAIERAATERPDVAVLDVVMPRLGGHDACRSIKQNAHRLGDLLPVLFLSSRADPISRVAGLRAGADDFMAKPFDPDELRARIAGLVRTRRLVDELVRLRAATPGEPVTALLDTLTGLYNQRYLTQRLEQELQRAFRNNEPVSVMAIDLDCFADVNERFGRSTGDRLLQAAAKALLRVCRDGDVVTRAGGDEFVVILPATHFAGSIGVAERVTRELAAAAIEEAGVRLTCAASVGVASYPSRDVQTTKDLLRFAHAALARAKSEGRGQICLYQHQGYLLSPS